MEGNVGPWTDRGRQERDNEGEGKKGRERKMNYEGRINRTCY